ncbi:uncharacterized protein TM35_000161620 [Trypanosoma theileri]|uniref:Sister chromatid cohesion protein n=1 Tax=Trypanosoma theileri TaxID=67003 RepID=A0A1X0NV00_9TRYP|nr:uncharacterized protein TM35_000161620 [Trypanosoma theileri]ORC88524.1 hypothetical protein TM35_000161620 [Trypanosoma theileri]
METESRIRSVAKRQQRSNVTHEMITNDGSASLIRKRPRGENTDLNSDDVLSGTVLHNKVDAQLLSWLFECHRILRAANPPYEVDSSFIKELLSPRYLKSSLTGVQQMTGCLLSDIVRLSNVSEIVDSRHPLPFDSKHADDILTCLASPFEQVTRGEALLKTCDHIIERASISHIFLYIIPQCRQPVQGRLTAIFKAVQQARGNSGVTDTAVSDNNNNNNNSTAITAITAAEMGRVLVDILNATNSITPEQLAPLLKEITAASPILLRHTGVNRNSGVGNTTNSNTNDNGNNNNNSAIANAARKKGRSPGAMIAARVLLEQIDVIQPAIASYIADMMEHGCGELTAADLASEEDIEARRRGLRDVGRAMESLVAMMELHVDLVGQLIPVLTPYLDHEKSDIRLLLLRGFFMAFGAHESAVTVYRSAFLALLVRFNDTKHTLRIEMLQLTASAIRASTQISVALTEERVRDLLPYVEQRLLDPHALVRRAAVMAYGDIMMTASSYITSERVEKTLGLRVADKNLKVRQTAVEQLCSIYQKQLFPWIPTAIMQCLNAEGGVTLLESTFEMLLPPPNKIMGTDTSLNNSNTSRLSSGGGGGRRSARSSMALFDFEKESATKERTYVDGFAKLCAHLNTWSFNRLLTFAAKKSQLRLTILRLFQLRAEVRNKDLKSSEGQEMINNIHRLLSFLQTITHAERGEWDILFRAKDDRVSKAFLSSCADGLLRYATERESLIKTLKGRVDGSVLKFVQDSLSKQMMLPLEVEHLEELMTRLREALRGACDNNEQATSIDSEVQCEVEGLMRTFLVFGRTAPSFLPRCALSLVEFLEVLCKSSNPNIPSSWVLLLLQCLTEWASYASKRTEQNMKPTVQDMTAITDIATHKKNLLTMLGKLCTCNHEFLFRHTPPKMVGAVCKQAARCFMNLLTVNGLRDHKALSQLIEALRNRIGNKASPVLCDTVGWLKSLTAFAKDRAAAPLLQEELLLSNITKLLFTAIQDDTETQDAAKVKTKGKELLPFSLAATVVDAAAKCLTAITLSYTDDRASSIITSTLNTLLGAYKMLSERDAYTVGACRRRLSINQQLSKLIIRPSSDIGKELAVAVILSAEDEVMVRRPVQQKLTFHILQNHSDMRYVAFLLLSVIAEETKSGYQQLRMLVQQVGDHLRSKQVTSGATLSSPNALSCFLEYTIPFLVLFMAHHTFYNSEQENHFVAYQRVWHLLFDELFRHGTQCASFLVELFSRIKQSDDVLDRNSHTIRILCDLGSRVLQECLGQRQIGAEALKRYPGRVLLPTFFVPSPTAAEALTTIYLDDKIHISAHVPFRPPATNTITTTTTTTTTAGPATSPGKTGMPAGMGGETTLSVVRSVGESEAFLLPPLLQQRVDRMLETLVGSMTQEDIANVPWSLVKQRLRETILDGKRVDRNNESDEEEDVNEEEEEEEVDEADVMGYAKEQLRLLYEKAPPQ